MRILISGYYGFGNAGDEAILAGLVGALRERLSQSEIVVLSADPEGTRRAYGVHAEPRWQWRTLWREIGAAGLLVQGGGGLIQDTTSRRSALYYLSLLGAAWLRGTPYVICGQGMGPLRGWLARRLTRSLFRQAQAITVRDPGSAELLAGIGVPRESVVVTADLAALVEPAPYEDVAHLLPPTTGGPRVGLALRSAPRAAVVATAAVEAAEQLKQRHGAQIVPLAMHHTDDAPPARDIAQRLGVAAVPGRHPSPSPSQWAALIRSLDFVIAMRLHACIFAAVHGLPFVALAYDPKVAGFAERAKAPHVSLDAPAQQVRHVIEAAWERREEGGEARGAFAEELRHEAARSIDPIEELVGAL